MMQKYVCGVCGYVYDPKEGDIDSGIIGGTNFKFNFSIWNLKFEICNYPLPITDSQVSFEQAGYFLLAIDTFNRSN